MPSIHQNEDLVYLAARAPACPADFNSGDRLKGHPLYKQRDDLLAQIGGGVVYVGKLTADQLLIYRKADALNIELESLILATRHAKWAALYARTLIAELEKDGG